MILQTIINGRRYAGSIRKKIVHPYNGKTPRSFVYARGLAIDPFEAPKDIDALRLELAQAVKKIIYYLKKEQKQILEDVSNETGSPIAYHKEDMDASISFLENLQALKKLFPKGYLSEPKGNILLIFSANEPIITTAILVFSSLFMGNSVFVKPSSKSPTFGYIFVSELSKIPALKKRIHYLLIHEEEAERLIRARSFDFVLSFGSRGTNKKLSALCAEAEIEFLPESEGNDWAYVDRSAGDIKKISACLEESFTRHNGQMCNAVRGVLVHASIYDALERELKQGVAKIPCGNPAYGNAKIGALLPGTAPRAAQIVKESEPHAESVWNFSADGNTISPTLILKPTEEAAIVRESIFAPVLWIKKVKNHAEAINFYAQHNKHGLGFSVFSKDKKVIDDCTRRIKAGRININRHPLHIGLFDPLGGVGLSGRGGPSRFVEKVSNRKYINR
ncbi:aldehyde dehydrogenase family protein [bacterium]|nr:aldehyde dehydrogenase family protein [bacterium]